MIARLAQLIKFTTEASVIAKTWNRTMTMLTASAKNVTKIAQHAKTVAHRAASLASLNSNT